MNKTMFFCTCSSNNYKKYLKNVIMWYKNLITIQQFKQFNIDYYTFSDGKITQQMINEFNQQQQNILKNKIKIISFQPFLGIHGINNQFKGWKRSFLNALKIGNEQYDIIVHIENDLKIINTKKFSQYMLKSETYCAFCDTYNFIQTACMILNNKQKNKIIINQFEDLIINNSFKITEHIINDKINPQIILHGVRKQSRNITDFSKYDYVGQIF